MTTGWWVIGLWWATWLFGNITFWYTTEVPTVREQIAGDQREIVGNVSPPVAAGLALAIVRAVERRQARARHLEPTGARAAPDGGLPLPAPPG